MSKFKAGEIVRCIKHTGATAGYRYGETYTVLNSYKASDGERIHTVLDSNGSTTNGWNVLNFESAAMPKAAADDATVLGTQIGGSHYTDCAIQPIEYIWANKLGFSEGNIIKYVTRYPSKGGIKDLEKAKHHIALLIERLQKEQQNNGA